MQRPEWQQITSLQLIDPSCQLVITVSGLVPYFDHAIRVIIIFPESYSLPTETARGAFHLTRVRVGCVDARSARSAFVDLLTFQHFCLFVLGLHTVFRAGCYKVGQQVPEIRESLRKELQVGCTSFGHAHKGFSV